MALQMNPQYASALFTSLLQAQNAPQMGAQGQPTPSTFPAATPEQQAILEGANTPSRAAQTAALQEQRILEGQNPQVVQQNAQQQATQNTPNMAQPQQSAIGNFSPEQIQQGQQGAQTNSEKGWWDTVKSNLTGEGLQGDELKEWRKNMTLAATLAQLGAAIGGDTAGGRLGEGVYQLGAGSLAAKNAELREQGQDDFRKAIVNALGGRVQTTQEQPQNSPTSQSALSSQSFNQREPALGEDMQSLLGSIDDTLARIRKTW